MVPNVLINDSESLESETLVCEIVIQQNLKLINPIFLIDGNIEEDKCGNCKVKTLLFYTCVCRKVLILLKEVWYCQENCFFHDEKLHKQVCEIINKVENVNVEEFVLEPSKNSKQGIVGNFKLIKV